MIITVCKGKVHRAVVTEAELHYEGSLTVDQDLMDLAGMKPYEQVSVVNVNNGARFETYLIVGERGSGTICLNGAAARLGMKGDKVIIITYGQVDEKDLPADYKPKVVFVDENNRPKKA
ncbi:MULTISPECIES: aspartate 1-decarboxylase [Leptospira]|uniref:Aspartate 1-decarboxylase n=3 Tax=Leptospira TaxID=171 RepID=A0A2N0AIE4_9LEPT|nr:MULTISPECIES: aspartate 1-decarboxylase [Leptospira]PKA24305.1 aspartate 1-decarboxylase [Leptospira sp. mixed culture ATI2-C-A1]EKJ87169.1 aspartate 1-decarboxylase [Leptospira meyeri serovar Hardjo str. Went 5]MCG6141406.1 aspartate 1-decarboxylase [Leptospira mtsangambouensis]MCW7487227.1 aspartate 1-decarboxylase [Leptospira meyeri]PJZ80939.1 aspartate 1-decarboxylase [Leptospira meyeri]